MLWESAISSIWSLWLLPANPQVRYRSAMRSFGRLRTHPSLLITAIIVLLVAHGMALYLFRHVALSATVALGMIILIVFKHLGLHQRLRCLESDSIGWSDGTRTRGLLRDRQAF